jgi:hypothetical protein
MLPLSLSKFKLSHRPTITRWLSSLNKVNSSFQHNIFHVLITVSLLIKLNPLILTVKSKNGLKLILELELPLTFQNQTRLFLPMERNTLIKHL